MSVLMGTGKPQLGEPSVFQVNFCMRGLRLSTQPSPGLELAW